MAHYAILTKFKASADVRDLPKRSQEIKERLIAEVPSLTGKWTVKLALLGGTYDAIDVVETENVKDVQRAADIISEVGNCTTDVVPVTHWHDFMAVTRVINGKQREA